MYRYNNPIISGFNPDPSICRCGEDFYLVTSTFEYFPGVPVYHSKNLVNWELISYVLDREEQLDLHKCGPSRGIFAPTIRYSNGYFFMTTTNVSINKNFIVYTKDPKGDWSNPVWIDQDGIDPSLLFASNGDVYFTSNGISSDNKQIIQSCKIDPFTGEKLSESKIISYGCGGIYPEGPHLYEINNKFYLMLAEGGTSYGHRETMQVSDDPFGPFIANEDNPIINHLNEVDSEISCTGHADLIQDQNDNWWIVFLGVRTISREDNYVSLHNLGRETHLAPVRWNEKGFPVVGNNGVVSLQMDGELPNEVKPVFLDFNDDFSSRSLNYEYLRNPISKNYELNTRDKTLILRGTGISINDQDSPTWIGVRQKEFNMEASVYLSLLNRVKDMKIGLSAYYNKDYHYEIYITYKDSKYYVEVAKKIHDLYVVTASKEIEYCDNLSFKIKANKEDYRFYYSLSNDDFVLLDKGMTAALCTESTSYMTFTGTFIAMFAEKSDCVITNFSTLYNKM